MSSNLVGNILKTRRKELNLPVKNVLEQLTNMGVSISAKTLYGWENGHRQPDADMFLLLCKIYAIDTISGLDKASPTENQLLSLSDENEKRLIELYRTLNVEGRERLLETADDMVQSKKYKEVGSFQMDAKEA